MRRALEQPLRHYVEALHQQQAACRPPSRTLVRRMGPGTPGRRLGRQPTSSCRSSIAFCHPIGCSKQWTGRFMRYHYHPLPNINAVFSMRFASHRLLCGMYWMFHVSSVTCVLRSFGALCIPRFRRLRLLHSTSSANSPPSRHRSASHHMSSQLTT